MATATPVLAHSGTLLGRIDSSRMESQVVSSDLARWLCVVAPGNTVDRNVWLGIGTIV